MPTPARRPTLLLLAIVLLSLNLRAPLLAVSPLLDDVRADLSLSGTAAGLLTTLPVLCFGALAPLAAPLARRFALEHVLVAALLVLLAGELLRVAPSLAALFAGTAVLGGALAVTNVLMPSLIKRDLPDRAGPALGIYSMSLNVGAALGAGLTVPLRDALGLGWRGALVLWAALALVALAVFLPVTSAARRERHAAGGAPGGTPTAPGPALWYDPVAWWVTGFFAVQSLQFYAGAAWLPTIFTDAGLSEARAGLLLSVFSLVGAGSALAAPVVAGRSASQAPLALVVGALYAVGWVGMLLAPAGGALAWMLVLGLAQGGGIGLGLTLFVLRAPDAGRTAQLSGMAQAVGYLGGSAGPLALGALHDLTGSWTTPLAVLLACAAALTLAGTRAGRPRWVGGAVPA